MRMVCKICGIEKDFEEFPKSNGLDANGIPKRWSKCKICYNKERAAKRPKSETSIYCECGRRIVPNAEACLCRLTYAYNKMINRKNNKARAVEYLGGKCKDCGFKTDINLVYDLHHRDPSTKKANISNILGMKRWEDVVEEVDKCDLICVNCHRIRHYHEKEKIYKEKYELRYKDIDEGK